MMVFGCVSNESDTVMPPTSFNRALGTIHTAAGRPDSLQHLQREFRVVVREFLFFFLYTLTKLLKIRVTVPRPASHTFTDTKLSQMFV